MKKIKYYAALYSAKITTLALKIFGKKVPYYPGVIAQKVDKNFIMSSKKPSLIIGVTGTNGKTTVSTMLCDYFKNIGKAVVSNDGYNLDTGVAASLVKHTNIFGKLKGDVWILEVDERDSGDIFSKVEFDYLIVTNLFRDSMKRNAHVEYIFNLIKKNLNKKTKLILNADDIISSDLDKYNNAQYYSISKLNTDKDKQESKMCDIRYCPKCGNELVFEYVRYHHIGKVKCSKCDFKNKKAKYVANIDFNKNEIIINNDKYDLITNSIFNAYNLLSVVSLLYELNYPYKDIKKGLVNLKVDTSRWDETVVNDIKLNFILAKGQNSIACSTVFKYLKEEKDDKTVLLMLDDVEDNIESTETISWIYDADFEFLNDDKIKQIIVGGARCYDYKLRLLIAGVDESKIKVIPSEYDMPELIDFNKSKHIYLLFEVFALEKATEVKNNIIKRMGEINDKN
ncbi:MAG: DUF1727 domain-containing protein [Tenericutes bacterium]|nr:DUF1727 domain-containing protein [Mycoplasmatota bacterium]